MDSENQVILDFGSRKNGEKESVKGTHPRNMTQNKKEIHHTTQQRKKLLYENNVGKMIKLRSLLTFLHLFFMFKIC